MSTDIIERESIAEAVREGRPLRKARNYLIEVAEGNLNFRQVEITEPVPLGRQILTVAGLQPDKGYSLFGILPSGDFEDLRLDEPFDIRGAAVERFVAFLSDRDFKLTIDEAQIKWGKPLITGQELYKLAGIGEEKAVFLRVPGGQDRLIEPAELLDLSAPGVEHFITAPAPAKTFQISVNGRPRVVNNRRVTFEQIVHLAFPGPQPENAVFSMTYRHAASEPHAGELGKGGSVDVKKQGTIFNVYRTIKS